MHAKGTTRKQPHATLVPKAVLYNGVGLLEGQSGSCAQLTSGGVFCAKTPVLGVAAAAVALPVLSELSQGMQQCGLWRNS